MPEKDELRAVVEDLIQVAHLQAKELEKLVDHVQQVAGRLGYSHQFSVVASELSELLVRVKKLGGASEPGKR